MRMQVILDSSFARPGSAPIWGRKKGEFRDWTSSDEGSSGITSTERARYIEKSKKNRVSGS